MAQLSNQYTGLLTVSIGASAGGDVRSAAVTPSVSLAILDPSGIGAELDLGHARRFDSRFSESGITSLMFNVTGGRTIFARFEPYFLAGVGLLRVRACCVVSVSRTDFAFNAGGGLLWKMSEVWGVRGDVRYLGLFEQHADLALTNTGSFDLWRSSMGVTLMWPVR